MSFIRTVKPNRNGGPADTWYVASDALDGDKGEYYVRSTKTFPNESEAKRFARDRLAAGCNVSAGTLNPHFPRRTIGPSQLESWLKAD